MQDAPGVAYAEHDGVHIAYQVAGDSGPDVVFATEWGTPLDLRWHETIVAEPLRQLTRFARLISFDRRGTGCSDRVPLDVVATPEEWADDIGTVMDAAGCRTAYLVGQGDSGPICMLFAATFPARVDGLVLINTYARRNVAPDYPWPPDEPLDDAVRHVDESWGDDGEILDQLAPSLAGDRRFRTVWAQWRRLQVGKSTAKALFRMRHHIDVRAVLPLIQCPTLVLNNNAWGAPMGAARYLTEQIPEARLVELPGRDLYWWGDDADAIVGEVEQFVTGSRAAPDVDRALATVLFTDIVGSTDRAVDLGDRRWHALLDRHNETIRGFLREYRGVEVKTTGDGFLATFDGPARAIRCATRAAAALAGLGIDIRAGIHTGEVEVQPGDIAGIAVHIAARVAGLGGAGQVVVSRTVRDLVAGSSIAFSDYGTHRLKGLPDDWQLYTVTSS